MVFDPIANRRKMAKGYAPQAITPEKPYEPLPNQLMKPFYDSGLLTADEEAKKKMSLAQKAGQFALNMALVPAAVVSMAAESIRNPASIPDTAAMMVEGVAHGFADPFNKEKWQSDPFGNVVNVISDVSLVGGLAKSSAMSATKNIAITAAKKALVDAGIDSVLVENVFKTSTKFGKIPMLKQDILDNAISEAVKLKSSAPFETTLRGVVAKTGVTDEVAKNISKTVSDNVVGSFLKNKGGQLAAMDAAINPVKIFGKISNVTRPIQELILGTPEKSAVGKLYGSDLVSKDLKGFGMTEEWAGQQAVEKGLPPTIENKVRIIQDWVESNPEYSILSPLERNKHLFDYAQADLARKNFAEYRGRAYILTKALPTAQTDSMVEFMKSLPKELTNKEVIAKLSEQYGATFDLHSQEVARRMTGKLEITGRQFLVKSIQALSNDRIPSTVGRLSKEEKVFVQEMSDKGYRLGKPPRRKKLSQAAELQGVQDKGAINIEGSKGDAINVSRETIPAKEELLAKRTLVRRVIDNLGLSPEGIVEGSQMFLFREAFNKGLLDVFGHDGVVIIDKIKYPIDTLAYQLNRLRALYVAKTQSLRVLPNNLSDLRYRDLIALGVGEKDASILDKVIRESVVTSPSAIGLGEAASNFLRTKNNAVSRAYNEFLKYQSHLRFKINPLFGLQAAIESVVWGNLWVKKFPTELATIIPSQPYFAKNIPRWIDKLRGLKTPLVEANKMNTINEQELVLKEVFGNYSRQLRDANMSPEIMRSMKLSATEKAAGDVGVGALNKRLDFENEIRDSNSFLGLIGFSNVKVGTSIMKAYAQRFGTTLEEALSFKVVNGKKVYNNQWMVNNMQDAAQAIWGYKPGLLTSPLMRTLNVIWFPARFETKTMIQTAKWIGSLSPTARALVVNDWVYMANWLTTPEGKKWKNGNRGIWANLFNYTFAFEGIGKTVEAATRGKLFGGNTGLVGGLPFGFVYSIARDFGAVPQDVEINQATGKPFQRTVIKKSASIEGFTAAVEDIILAMSPSIPLNMATGGVITASPNRLIRSTIEEIMSAMYSVTTGTPFKKAKKQIQGGKMNVKSDYQKRLPDILGN